jgi:hypothetical protein
MVELGGQQVKLIQGPKDEANRLLAEEKFAELRRLSRIAPQAPTARSADVIESFLAWSRQHLATETHRVNQYYCQLFAEHCGTVPARELRPFHVTKWIASMMDPKRVRQELELRRVAIEAGEIEKRYQGVNAEREVQRLLAAWPPIEKCSAPNQPRSYGGDHARDRHPNGRRQECSGTWRSGSRFAAAC